MRSAHRLGGNALAIAKARIGVIKKAANAKALLDAVPADAQRDIGYIFSRAQWLRRADKIDEAGALILSVPREPPQALDTDQWWIERRLIARKLLDIGDNKSAYRVARDASPPGKENYRIEQQFTAGWIALRFLNDPSTAQAHFSRMAQGVSNPDLAVARRLLAGPRPRGARPDGGSARGITRPRRSIRPPITARSPAPGSATRTWRCVHCRSAPGRGQVEVVRVPPSCSTRSASAISW